MSPTATKVVLPNTNARETIRPYSASGETVLDIPGTMPDPKHRTRGVLPRKVIGPVLPACGKLEVKNSPAAHPFTAWWPVAAGVALACLAPQLRTMLTAFDPWGMRAVFPFALVLGRHEIGMSDELTRTLPQMMLFLQFPLEGLLTKFNLDRGVRLTAALTQIFFLHAVCAFVLWLVSGAAQ